MEATLNYGCNEATREEKFGLLVRYVPILDWLPHYHKAWLLGDIVAGLSVRALMLPQCLGFAAICGVPVQYGLYAAAIALIVYAFFASSRHVVTGPSSTIAAVTGAAVLSTAKAGSSEAIALVAVITLLAGCLYIILSILKMGWVSNFLAESVLVGFVFGIGIDVAVGQLKHVTGTPVSGESVWLKLASWIMSLPQTSLTTLAVGVVALVILIGLKKYAPSVPGALGTLVLGIGASAFLDLSAQGVAVVGKVPRGLPVPALPDISLITENMKGVGVEIHLARVKQEIMKIINKDGVDHIVGRDHIHQKAVDAVQWFLQNQKNLSRGETKNG